MKPFDVQVHEINVKINTCKIGDGLIFGYVPRRKIAHFVLIFEEMEENCELSWTDIPESPSLYYNVRVCVHIFLILFSSFIFLNMIQISRWKCARAKFSNHV